MNPMKKHLFYLLAFTTLALGACKKDYGDGIGPLQDSVAGVPVTVTNRAFFERVPIVIASGAPLNAAAPVTGDSPFSITFEIPSEFGAIREISRVQTGVNGLRLLNSGTPQQAFNFDPATSAVVPIAGNGTNSITFNSTLRAYTDYRTRAIAITGANGGGVNAGQPAVVLPNTTFSAQVPNQLRYWFLLTLADGRQVIPMEVRVRVTQ